MEICAAICTYLTVLFSFLNVIECRIGFEKDLSMDVVFPPIIVPPKNKVIPVGHFRPLGFQTRATGKIAEILNMPSAHAFEMKYIKQNRPVNMREALKKLPVFKLWNNDDYLKDKYGQMKITATVKKQKKHHKETVMKFKKFLVEYKYEDWWLESTIPQEIADELPLPDCLRCGTYKQRLQEAQFWMSSGGTASLLHSHDDHNLHCVLFGRKDFILIEGKYKDTFNYIENYKNAGAGYSPLDMDRINLFQNPGIKDVPWTYATVQHGDCIFIPAGYLHQVNSYGRGISYSVLFSPSLTFDSSDCNIMPEAEDKEKHIRLSDVAYVWVARDSRRELSAMNLEPSILKKYLLLLLRADDGIYFEKFEHFYNDALKHYPDHPPADEAFDILTGGKGKAKLSREQVENLNPNQLNHLAKIFNDARAKQRSILREEL